MVSLLGSSTFISISVLIPSKAPLNSHKLFKVLLKSSLLFLEGLNCLRTVPDSWMQAITLAIMPKVVMGPRAASAGSLDENQS